jgi:hypothetical protein
MPGENENNMKDTVDPPDPDPGQAPAQDRSDGWLSREAQALVARVEETNKAVQKFSVTMSGEADEFEDGLKIGTTWQLLKLAEGKLRDDLEEMGLL